MQIKKCTFRDCRATTAQPGKDGWTYFADVKPLADGLYCPVHAHAMEQDAMEQVLQGGGFDDPDDLD